MLEVVSAANRISIPTVFVAPGESLLSVLDGFRRETGHTGHCVIKFSRPQPLKAPAP